jgi:hypothetical protein
MHARVTLGFAYYCTILKLSNRVSDGLVVVACAIERYHGVK